MNRRDFFKVSSYALGLLVISGEKPEPSIAKGAVITAKEFREWLASFMVYGSDQKEATCDVQSFNAILVHSARMKNGFWPLGKSSTVNGEHQTLGEHEQLIMTPFGVLKLRCDKEANGITVIDPHVRHRRKLNQPNQALLESRSEGQFKTIKEILA